jgi:MoaA/NifB/PqqE/SkfB family radical SAM enzyme
MGSAIIRLGALCNNKCIFCHARDKQGSELSTDEVIKKLGRLPQDVDTVLFSGGEPTLRKDIAFLMDAGRSKGLLAGLVSNGRMLSSPGFLSRVSPARVYTSLHSCEGSLHDLISQDRSFQQVLCGIRNCIEKGIFVSVNCVVNTVNMHTLSGTAELLAELRVDRFRFSFVEPITESDMAHVPDINQAAEAVKEAMRKSRNAGWDCFPLCLMRGFESRHDGLKANGIGWISEPWEDGFYPADQGKKKKADECLDCLSQDLCEGIYTRYLAHKMPVLSPYS